MITLTGARDIRMQILTERTFCVRYHWRGRSLLCGGHEDCLGCQIERPRPVFYAGAAVKFAGGDPIRGVVEMCATAHVAVVTAARTFGRLQGVVVSLRRHSPRSEWRCHASCWGEPKNVVMDERDVMASLACVLRVDDAKDGEGFEAWIKRVAVMHAGLMRGTQLIPG